MRDDRPEELPGTFAEAHDLLHSMFGIGSYDDVVGQEPWFQSRMTEIAKIKAIATRRRATPEQIGMAAWWAKKTGVHVRTAVRLFPLIPEAQREWRKAIAAEAQRAAQVQLNALIEEALACGEGEWAERFIRASPAQVPDLTTAWRSR